MKRLILLALLAIVTLPASAQTRILAPGGSYSEAQPGGRFAVLYADSRIETHAGPLALHEGVNPLYLRLSPDGEQIGGQGHSGPLGGQAIIWTGRVWANAGPAHGVSPVAFWPDGRVEVSTPEKFYGSQGIRWISDRVYTGDETYASAALGLHEYTRIGRFFIGQGSNNGGVTIVEVDGAGREIRRKRLAEGLDFFIRANGTNELRAPGDELAVAWWQAVGGGATDAHLIWLTVDQIGALPDDRVSAPAPVPAPVPVPSPIPDPAPSRGPPQESLFSIVEAVWTKHRGENRGAMVNEIAWLGNGGSANGPWGLSRKTGGAHVVQPRTGERVAHDIVQHVNGTLFDVFRDEGPTWGEAHPHNDPSRIWLPAVAPEGVTPDPVKPADPRLAELEKKLAEAEILLAKTLREVHAHDARIAELEAERDDLQRQLEEARAERDAAIVAADAAGAALAKARCTASIFGIKIRCKVIQ